MAEQFYYQVSSLPMLRFGEPAPLTPAAFDEFCRGQLPAAVAAALARLTLVPEGRPCCEVERLWQVWETYVRNCLVQYRAARLQRDPAASLRPDDDVFPGDRRRLEEIFSDADPRRRDLELDRLRWQRLDDLAVGHDFDLGALVLYKLRLLLVGRWSDRSAAEGTEVHDGLVEAAAVQAAERRVASGTSIAN